MSKYNTNLASEFHVLSILHRLGVDANLTLGNKKTVDIVVTNDEGDVITIDVKGIAKKYDWPANNIRIDLIRLPGTSPSGIGYTIERREVTAKDNKYQLIDSFTLC